MHTLSRNYGYIFEGNCFSSTDAIEIFIRHFSKDFIPKDTELGDIVFDRKHVTINWTYESEHEDGTTYPNEDSETLSVEPCDIWEVRK